MQFLISLSGGYPELLTHLLCWWHRNGKPYQMTRQVQQRLQAEASGKLTRFVKWLDPQGDRLYRDSVIDLFLDSKPEEARDILQGHSWREALLGADGLRADAVGLAAWEAGIQDARQRRLSSGTDWIEPLERAYVMYGRRQYDAAANLLAGMDQAAESPALRLFETHVLIMNGLYRGGHHSVEDIDLPAVQRGLKNARKLLEKDSPFADDSECELLQQRYKELDDYASALDEANRVQGRMGGRLADVLAGLAGKIENPRAAVLLLWMKNEASKVIPGPALACQAALPLPEQLYRVWAFWRLGLNYYKAPAGDDILWQQAQANWPAVKGELRRCEAGQEFPSFACFAYYSLAAWQHAGKEGQAPCDEFRSLESDLGFHEALRNGKAHALTPTSQKSRDRFFELIHRWLDCTLAACPDRQVTHEWLEAFLSPLPAVEGTGVLRWS